MEAARKIQYQNADCFMICIAVNMRDSFLNLQKWINEISAVAPEAPLYLILTKTDLDDKKVTFKELKAVQKANTRVLGVHETSSKTSLEDWSVHNAFKKTLGSALKFKVARAN